MYEQKRDTLRRKTVRENLNYRTAEKKRETLQRNLHRNNLEYRMAEQERDTLRRKTVRKNLNYRTAEKNRETSQRNLHRNNPEYRMAEQEREALWRKLQRRKLEYKAVEKKREKNAKKRKRSDQDFREREKIMNTGYRRAKRRDPVYRANEREGNTRRTAEQETSIDQCISNFHRAVEQGPVYTCTSCHQLLYKHSVCKYSGAFSDDDKQKDAVRKLLDICPQKVSAPGEVWVCKTCQSHMKKGKIPPSSVLNRMNFPDQGPLHDLNPLEQTLIAARLPFMKIHQAPISKQHFINGNVVMVPADVSSTIKNLPRLPSDTATIKATLKRRLRYKHHVYCLNIRPEAVREAAKFLATAPLYKEHGISFDESWNCETEMEAQNIDINIHSNSVPESNSEDCHTPPPLLTDSRESMQLGLEDARKEDENCSLEDGINDPDDDDKWSEVDIYESMCGEADTLLTAPSFVDQSEMEQVYNYAPGEGSIPVSIFMEKDSEELAFPAIFCGRRRPSNTERPVRVTYGEIVKSELRNVDRRAARSVENLFFKTKKIQMKTLIDQTQIALRKVKTSNHSLSAKDVKGDAALDLIHHDKAYKFLANIRGSPPYFEKVSKDLFAFIRNLGTATFFLTLSAAETKWYHLLKILSQVVDEKILTDDEVSQLTWPQKCRLIQSDPITCARHFDFSVQKFLNKFLLTKANPLFEITDYFYRVEYQQRGSPHIHMLLWCKNAPKYGEHSESEVCNFIDEYITCKKPNEDESIFDLVQVQKHKHSHTCKKRNRKICRFNFPRPPMKATAILEPLKTPEMSEEDIHIHKQSWNKIHEYLQNIDENDETITHEVLLSSLSMTEEEYVCAIRTSIKATTVFLKRSPQEIRINNYNRATLEAWRANIDVQFVLDVYACATYVASYVTKAQRGMSELLRKATEEARQGNQSLKQQVRCVGNKFLNAVELSAQEAAYICLQLPMKRASRQCMFVNTSPPEERVTLLKPAKILDSLDDEDEDIECSNVLKRYGDRPQELENICLAEFCAWYTVEDTKKNIFKRVQ
ncbi:uncharacterized protein LOC134241554 [Saccostrea cucullata]|uniref:uncharacterized protein LOC134241554 n=1 Tax=Saccostrea cuccullata TaxID=36930 RepID=UPI002ED2FAB4